MDPITVSMGLGLFAAGGGLGWWLSKTHESLDGLGDGMILLQEAQASTSAMMGKRMDGLDDSIKRLIAGLDGVRAAHPELDGTYLNSFYGGDLDYASAIFGEFLKTGPDLLSGVELALDDPEALQRALHKLKPTLAMVGLTVLHSAAIEAEVLSKTKAPEARDKAVELLADVGQWLVPLANEY